jgi:hypothetical protein
MTQSRDSSVGIANGFGADDRGSWVSLLAGGLGIFLFTTVSRTVLEPTQPPIQYKPGALSPGVKRLVSEADHLSQSSAEVKNTWSYTPKTSSRRGAYLSTGTTLLYITLLFT